MKVLYTAGPIRSNKGNWFVQQNCWEAAEVAMELWKMGFSVICPHLNTMWFDGPIDHDTFIEGDLEIIGRCDGIVMLPGWRMSLGSIEEYQFARDGGIDIYMWPSDRTRLIELGRT